MNHFGYNDELIMIDNYNEFKNIVMKLKGNLKIGYEKINSNYTISKLEKLLELNNELHYTNNNPIIIDSIREINNTHYVLRYCYNSTSDVESICNNLQILYDYADKIIEKLEEDHKK